MWPRELMRMVEAFGLARMKNIVMGRNGELGTCYKICFYDCTNCRRMNNYVGIRWYLDILVCINAEIEWFRIPLMNAANKIKNIRKSLIEKIDLIKRIGLNQ